MPCFWLLHELTMGSGLVVGCYWRLLTCCYGYYAAGGCCWATSSLLLERCYDSPQYNGQFFLAYISIACSTLTYPLHLATKLCAKDKPSLIKTQAKADAQELVTGSRSKLTLVASVLGFCALWTLSDYTYIRAIGFGRAYQVTAKYALYSSFQYIMYWVGLEQPFFPLRVRLF